MKIWHALAVTTVALSAPIVSGCLSAGSPQFFRGCERSSERHHLVGEPLSVAEVEAASIVELRSSPAQSTVPFGPLAAEWEKLRSQMKPGDVFYKYRGPGGRRGAYAWGYALVRGECIVGTIVTEYITLA
jgi:hypothetical protein